LGTTNGALLVRLHTTDNNLHIFSTFIDRGNFDTRFLWTNIRPSKTTGDFDISHQTITIATDAEEAFENVRHSTRYFPRDQTTNTAEHGDGETEETPAPPYEPSPPNSPENQQPNVIDNEGTPRMEEDPREEEDTGSEHYQRATDIYREIDTLD
jgi:hypothetical protein